MLNKNSPRVSWPMWPASITADTGVDIVAVSALAAGFLALALPMFWDWSRGTFASSAQGHEIVIVAISAWLGYRKRLQIESATSPASRACGLALFVVGLFCYYVGRSYDLRLALIALVVMAGAILMFFKGFASLRTVWFALVFPIFAAPLPLDWVLALTGPLKIAVSAVATDLLRMMGYDAGHSGVVVTVGQYQLLVTEACAGLQTMFTLEAMGLLYANLMGHKSIARNALLTVLVVPIAFTANVCRVMLIALVTFHLGDAAGQGFLHNFAGLVLFAIAMALVIGVDWLLGKMPWFKVNLR